ncbi:flagellar export protein FliJ [Catenovulum maritimum]|uniref:flagellar export protein FliJ n=1 Tax=Catenovulum maritimum TaxID=1513271 RepID=UPI001FE04233|nr:flagellar export protein FliJ [Catenovulum maritimum]
MVNKQLLLIAEIEQKKEDQLALQFAQAQQALTAQYEKMAGLEKYQRDYMENIIEQGKGGISSTSMSRFQAFVSQLDKACGQQKDNIEKAEKVVDQRRALWLQQQRKRKSIELVVEKQKKLHQVKLGREEQKMFDEIVTNRFARR